MQKLDKIAEELFNKIRGRYPKVTLGTEVGEVTSDPGVARFFEFNYRNLGKVSVSLEEKNGIVVMYSKKLTDDTENKTQFFEFLRELRMFAKKRMLNFDTRDLTKSNLKKRDYQHLATTRPEEGTMTESKLYGTSRVSYQDVGSARLVVKHSQAVNPELAASRTQNIQSMYIESAEGERFKYPYRHLNGARAMARHVAEGGNAYDDFGKHIVGLSEELSKLRKFKNYMGRSSVMAEGLSGYMDAVHERIDTVKDRITKLQRESFYKEAVDGFETPVFEDVPDEVRENWIDQLTIRQFNEELADVFPYIYKLVSETTLAEELGPDDLLGEGQDVDEYANEPDKDFGGYDEAIESSIEELMGQFGEEDKKDVLFQIEDEDGDKYEVVKYMGKIVAFDANPEELPGGGMGPYEYDPKTGTIETEHGPKKTRKTGEQTFDEADFDKNFQKRVAATVKGGKGAEYMKKKADQAQDANPDKGKGIGPGVLDTAKARKKAKEKGAKAPGSLRASPNTRDPKRLPEDEQQLPLSEKILSYFDHTTGQFPKGETAVLTMVEKDYGEEYIEPAKQFIEMINNKVAEMYGYKEQEDTGELERVRGLAGL